MQPTTKRQKLGDILIGAGVIDLKQMWDALEMQSATGDRLGKILVDVGFLTESDLVQALSEQLGFPVFEAGQPVSEEVVSLFSTHFLTKNRIIPVERSGNRLRIAMVDPLDQAALGDIEFMVGCTVEPMLATDSTVEAFLKSRSGGIQPSNLEEALRKIESAQMATIGADDTVGRDDDILKLRKAGEAKPIVRIVNTILADAVRSGASDIHIEPRQQDILIRYRIDGLLRNMSTLPARVHPSIISRLKILARMDISVRRRPQDGSMKTKIGDVEVDLRVSTLPIMDGEKMVIRILGSDRRLRTLKELGMRPRNLDTFLSLITRPQGMVLVTGPTGSGKTTTLYAALLHTQAEELNLITVEDPIEYQIPGCNQVQVNEKTGITFATGLRSILRQDPNIIMVGEIRDRETAEIAFQASLTGHLVFSTLHTNNAVSTITRLVDIGVDPYLVASCVAGVVAQRLVRRNCPNCLERHVPDKPVLKDLGLGELKRTTLPFYRGIGCKSCDYTGYQGRIGIYEMFPVHDAVKELIYRQRSEGQIQQAARRSGMTSMVENGLYLALNKITTPEEILRVIPPEEILSLREADRFKKLLASASAGKSPPPPRTGNQRLRIQPDDNAI